MRVNTRTHLAHIAIGLGAAMFISLLAPLQGHANTIKIINVKSYGAKGDGITDDTVAIRRAIGAQTSEAPSVVFFPAGRYLFSGHLELSPFAFLKGDDAPTELISTTNDADLVIRTYLGKDVNFQTRIEKLNFVAAKKVKDTVIIADRGGHLTLNHCQFTSEVGAIRFRNLFGTSAKTYLDVSHCQFADVEVPILVDNAASIILNDNVVTHPKNKAFELAECTNVMIQNNTINSAQKGDAPTAITMNECYPVTVNANTIACANPLLLKRCDNVTFTGNKLLQFNIGCSLDYALAREAKDAAITISKNDFNGTGSQAPTAIFAIEGHGRVRITDNTFEAVGNAVDINLPRCDVVVSNNKVDNASIAVLGREGRSQQVLSNKISNCSLQGIRVRSDYGGVTITGNSLTNCGLANLSPFKPPDPPTVIFSDSQSSKIENNSYTGNVKNLEYFIYTTGPATVQGNTTNTELPNRIGP